MVNVYVDLRIAYIYINRANIYLSVLTRYLGRNLGDPDYRFKSSNVNYPYKKQAVTCCQFMYCEV